MRGQEQYTSCRIVTYRHEVLPHSYWAIGDGSVSGTGIPIEGPGDGQSG